MRSHLLVFSIALYACGSSTGLRVPQDVVAQQPDITLLPDVPSLPDIPVIETDVPRPPDTHNDAVDLPEVSSDDVLLRLQAIPGIRVNETTPGQRERRFEIWYTQPVDHDNPNGPQFEQYLTLIHRGNNRPVVFESTGYANFIALNDSELSLLLDCNQIAVEHRYFATSVPAVMDWSKLTIRQAAADHHRIAAALRGIYTGPWVSTGVSKGGMTAIFHRRFYPNDVEATVAYVAPISFGAPDPRYQQFFATVGQAPCRERVQSFQLAMLDRREGLLERTQRAATINGYDYSLSGGTVGAFENAVLGLEWSFWQYAGAEYCDALPDPRSLSDDDLFNVLETYSPPSSNHAAEYLKFLPYYYQAETELGWGNAPYQHLENQLMAPPGATVAELTGTMPVFNPAPMRDVQQWIDTEATQVMYVYGEWDPWTAGSVRPIRPDQVRYDQSQGTHLASLSTLSTQDQSAAYDTLERWLGVSINRRTRMAPSVWRNRVRRVPPFLPMLLTRR